MDLGPHTAFIVAAYLLTGAVIIGLIVWVVADYRSQVRLLADLERRGISRRSSFRRPGS
jgi:heme exporter protein D